MEGQRIVIGRIGAPHGIRGEVRAVPLTDFPERFQTLKRVYLDDNTVLTIDAVKYANQCILMKIHGVDDRDAAELLKGKLLQVPRSEAAPLGEGEYYNFDIIGLEVYSTEDELLGKVSNIIRTGSNDVYVINGGEKQILIPALKKVVTKIDLDAGRMTIVPQEEL